MHDSPSRTLDSYRWNFAQRWHFAVGVVCWHVCEHYLFVSFTSWPNCSLFVTMPPKEIYFRKLNGGIICPHCGNRRIPPQMAPPSRCFNIATYWVALPQAMRTLKERGKYFLHMWYWTRLTVKCCLFAKIECQLSSSVAGRVEHNWHFYHATQ